MQREFYYQARDCNGKLIAGKVQADSRNAAANSIQLRGYFIIKLQDQENFLKFTELKKYFVKCDQYQLALLFKQLAILLQAGVPLLQGLAVLQQESEHNTVKLILSDLYNSIRTGSSLSQAMQLQPQYFSNFIICLITVGENSGRLDEILDRLAQHLTKSVEQQKKLRSALTYPVFLIIFAVLVILILTLYVLPIFADMFSTMQLTLPLPTKLLLAFTAVIAEYGFMLGSGIIILWSLIIHYRNKPQGRRQLDKLLLKTPFIGKMLFKLEAARYARVLSILLESGVTLLTAMSTAAKSANNKHLYDLWIVMQDDIQAGRSFADALKKLPLNASLLVQMIAVGEKTGKLDFMLEKAAELYEEAVNIKMQQFTVLLEPSLTIILGIIVGTIVISVALPIFESITQTIS